MAALDIRRQILARLAEYDAEHETSGCPGKAGECLHSAVTALRAVVESAGNPELRMSAVQEYAVYAAAARPLGLIGGAGDG